ncbi:hypothetical protein HD597_006997 [Nonomuraea thailandensis]|uniref:PqqD family protein n=1 Tax=Nonomuraea thailandensis TaxID=1188745 RepID=A0A9X2K3Z3_9ACTN|nr:hypothetical protein [Nonomuraea thailandensis]MCP2359977.1 hypothetical protein [Nonomuraea thailandensis]
MATSTDEDLRARAARLTIAHDGETWILGRPELGVFVAVPEPGAVFVTTLQDTGSLEQAMARAGDVAGEPVDGADFLEGLTAAGLLDPPGEAPDTRGRVKWIEGVSPRTAARLFGRVAWSCYGAAAVLAVGLLLFRPDLRPSWEDAWFLPSPGLSLLIWLLLAMACGALHEAWHWLAGRAIGVPAAFRVSYRGLYVVYETDLTQIVTVPRDRRHGVYLAGMAIDVVVLAAALGARLLGVGGVLGDLLAAVSLLLVVNLVWQWAALPLRSDAYALLANALRCHNLYRATWLMAKSRLFRLTAPEAAELSGTSERDQSVARWFVIPYVAGIAVMVWMFATIVLPLAVSLGEWGLAQLTSGTVTSAGFLEALAVAVYLAVQLCLPPALALRERRLRRSGRLL